MAQGKLADGRNQARDYPSSARVIELVDTRRQDSLRANYRLFAAIPEWYNLYRGVWQGRLAQFRNNVSVPFLYAMIHSDVARKVQISLGSWPLVDFEGYAPEDIARAKKNSVLVSAQFKDARAVLKAADLLLSADLTGTGIARYGWKRIHRRNRITSYEEIAPGLEIPVLREYDAEFFNGPDFEVIDRLDFWQCPGFKDIDEMPWAICRYWKDLDDLKADAASDRPYYDPSAIRLLEQAPLSIGGSHEYHGRRYTFRSPMDYDARYNQRFAKPVEIWEMHGFVPEEFAINGVRTRCIAIGNGRVVMKNREEPFWDQRKPFVSYSPTSDPYTFDPPGKVEINAPLQRTVNRLSNQKLDALDLVIDPQYVVKSTINLNTQHLFSRAGRIILVDDNADDSNFRPLTPNIQGLNQAYTEIAQLHQFMQLGAGINDIVLGVQGSDRETARGTLARQENAMTRLGWESRVFEEGWLEPMANAFRNMDRWWLPLPYERKILGSLSQINPITGLPYEAERLSIDADDLAPDYRARAVGASQMMGRSVRQQNIMTLLQVMSANPALIQLVNWANFARQMFELFDFKNVNELLVQQNVPAVNQLAAQTGQSPEQIAGTVSQPLTSLSPEILALLGNNQPVAPLGQLAAA